MNGENKEEMEKMISKIEKVESGPRETLLKAMIKAIQAKEAFSGIAEIHPAWLVEALRKESPRVIGVILRHLPSKHVRYLLSHLPRHIVSRLPKLVESFYVPTEILDLIRKRFERHFVPMRISHQVETFQFGHLYYLKMEELESLFRELGLSELALALMKLTRKMVRLILNRFAVSDAKTLLARMKAYREIDPGYLREARYSILELSGKEIGVERFLKEVGFLSLVKAFGPSDSFLFEALKQKLSPESAYVLKRYLEEQMNRFRPLLRKKRQKWVLDHVKRLAVEGRLDPIWSESFKQEAA